LVESTDVEAATPAPSPVSTATVVEESSEREGPAASTSPADAGPRESSTSSTGASGESAPPRSPGAPAGPTTEQMDEAVRSLTEIFKQATVAPHWPMYLRNVKQYIKNAGPTFDERKFGFTNFLETVRACQRAGLFRLERNRQGILRVFPGPQFPSQLTSSPMSSSERERAVEAAYIAAAEAAIMAAEPRFQAAPEPEPILEAPAEEVPVAESTEERPARRRTPRVPSDGVKRKPAARRTASPRRVPRKKPESESTD
jgi:hypothetical protein